MFWLVGFSGRLIGRVSAQLFSRRLLTPVGGNTKDGSLIGFLGFAGFISRFSYQLPRKLPR